MVTMGGKTIKPKGAFLEADARFSTFTLVNQELKNFTLTNFTGEQKVLSTAPSLNTLIYLPANLC